jgi:hypothetical protein
MAAPGQSTLGRLIVDNNTAEILVASVGAKAFRSDAFDDSTLEKNSSDGKARIKPGGIGRDELGAKGGTWVRANLLDGTGGGGIASIVNPFGTEVIIVRVIFQVTVVSTIASTVDVGLDVSATASSDKLLDGLDVGTATGVFGAGDEGASGKAQREWPAGFFVTASQASGTVTGLSGYIALQCVQIDS